LTTTRYRQLHTLASARDRLAMVHTLAGVKQMATVKIEYLGVEGIGPNVTKAKQDAARQVERIMGHLRPSVYSFRGYVLVCWIDKYGASYTIADSTDSGEKIGSCSGGLDKVECEERGIRHLLDITRTAGEFLDGLPDWVPTRIVRKHATRWASDWRSNDEFQRRYKDAESRGMNPHDCHSYAGRDPSRPELWQEAAA